MIKLDYKGWRKWAVKVGKRLKKDKTPLIVPRFSSPEGVKDKLITKHYDSRNT